FKNYHSKNADMLDNFAVFPSNHLSLVRKDGALDFYHGVLRAVDSEGKKILNDVDYQDYLDYIAEEVRNWSYMKFPYMTKLGKEKGWYTVGPLARLNTCDFIPSPLAQQEFEQYKKYTNNKPNNMSMHMHYARLIELLHSAEIIKELLNDEDIMKGEKTVKGKKKKEGVGLLEAPRGTLFHHYCIDDNDQITMANLIVSTTNNNQPMNNAVECVAQNIFTGQKEISEGMMNKVEMAIRAYDPCLSCATHALGKMPLKVALVDRQHNTIAERTRG
ncbi:MAG TPA: nickel-dependent hydrogenase large subunit, partial [Spirochaetota bacterium]|nr:nickel-dependent hydrogenase large subunit [Spirochaetota bacterium]